MGVMRFQVSPPGLLARLPEWDQAYITGADKRVFACRVEAEGDTLTILHKNRIVASYTFAGPSKGMVVRSLLRVVFPNEKSRSFFLSN